MGEVYQATDSKLGREIAIKVLPDELARDEERLRRVQREAKVPASLNHSNIAAIYGLEQSGRLIWKILHQGVDYEERGPEVTRERSQRRVAQTIVICLMAQGDRDPGSQGVGTSGRALHTWRFQGSFVTALSGSLVSPSSR